MLKTSSNTYKRTLTDTITSRIKNEERYNNSLNTQRRQSRESFGEYVKASVNNAFSNTKKYIYIYKKITLTINL